MIPPEFDAITKNIGIKRKNECYKDTAFRSKEEMKDNIEEKRIKDTLLVPGVDLMS